MTKVEEELVQNKKNWPLIWAGRTLAIRLNICVKVQIVDSAHPNDERDNAVASCTYKIVSCII